MERLQSFLISKQGNERLQVPSGETVIGRGPFLKVKDKRVSRSHATLSFDDGRLKIKPTHTNPTFLLTGSASKYKILEKDIWKELHDGDTISLLPDDLIFTIEMPKVTNPPTSPSASISEAKIENPEHLVADPVSITEEDLVKPVAAKSVDSQDQSPCKEKEVGDINMDTSKVVRTSFLESSNEVMDESAWNENSSSNDRKTNLKSNDPSPADEAEVKAPLPDITQTKSSNTKAPQRTASKSPKSTKRILPSWMTSPGKGPDGKGPSKGTEKKKKSAKDDPVLDAKTKATKKSSVATQNKQGESAATSGSKKRSPSIEKEEIPTPKRAKSDEVMNSEDAKKINSKSSNDKETDDGVEQTLKKHNSQTVNSGKVNMKQSKAESAQILKVNVSEKDDLEVSKDNLEKKHDSRSSTSTAATSDSISKDARSAKKLPKCPFGPSCYRKNPVHFQEYSHDDGEDDDDSDDDKDDEDLPECPYGTSCYRQNPQHKREYKHTKPPEAQEITTRKSTRTRKNPKKKSAITGDSDDDGEDNDYDYDDSFIDDGFEESDVSSYGDAEDDSDYTPGAVEEELNELKS
eukprot:Seg630.2 transcript_id=Seg630.2/GoldUCD/mRNA.D3Y31 product="Aprataxin and PNK-like factor" protein_id=Seg630.2/GoldUCD/D3Y31